MSFIVISNPTRTKACSNCPGRNQKKSCDGSGRCAGYGTSDKCPPLVVLAVIEVATRALAVAKLPAFGSMRSVTA